LKKKINIYVFAAVYLLIIISAALITRNIIYTGLCFFISLFFFIFYNRIQKYKINYIFKVSIIVFIVSILLLIGNSLIFTSIFSTFPPYPIAAISIVFLFFLIIHFFSNEDSQDNGLSSETQIKTGRAKEKILDTSVIIDGRIVDLCNLNFIEGTIIIPKFILKELQTIADSHDNLKRNRGRRGLEVLNRIQNELKQSIKIIDDDFPEIKEADEKLIRLAKKIGASLITNDYNLNKIAELQTIEVVNLNDLANALKPVMLPGEQIEILIVKEGKEHNQGIGYLNDGTMVVIDNSNKNLNKIVKAVVTSTIQTSAGRMIFGKKPEDLNK